MSETPRCPRCGWRYAARKEDGCTPGNCSYRPEPGSEEYRRLQRRIEQTREGDGTTGNNQPWEQPA